jgi:hypothetical protein
MPEVMKATMPGPSRTRSRKIRARRIGPTALVRKSAVISSEATRAAT